MHITALKKIENQGLEQGFKNRLKLQFVLFTNLIYDFSNKMITYIKNTYTYEYTLHTFRKSG